LPLELRATKAKSFLCFLIHQQQGKFSQVMMAK
jgi:hypothetical protein